MRVGAASVSPLTGPGSTVHPPRPWAMAMQEDLQEERRIAEKRWSKREKQLQRVVLNTSGMYGDLQGLIGSSLEEIPVLTPCNSLDNEQPSAPRKEFIKTKILEPDDIPV